MFRAMSVCCLILVGPGVRAQVAAAGPELAAAICARFEGFDHDGDGEVEIARLRTLHAAGDRGPRVLVLVEERLLRPAHMLRDLKAPIARLVDDLALEGHRAIALRVELGASERHQDGRYVLALRELLRAFAADSELRAVLLVGHFPDAYVVRTCNWRKHGDVTVRKDRPDQRRYRGVSYLRRVPEDVAHRADLVLADLDGHWEHTYVQPRTRLETVHAVFDSAIPTDGGACVDAARGVVEFEDFFHVDDGRCELFEQLGPPGTEPFFVALDDRAGGAECSPTDRQHPNRIAHPDVLVSRIDARGTAMWPKPAVVDVHGAHLLGPDGSPQALTFEREGDVPDWRRLYQPDERFERRLLADYLDRNHAFRTGAATVAFRPSSLACGLGSGFAVMRRAAANWAPPEARADVSGHPRLVEAADWLAYPAVLRTLRAHSDPWGSVFEKADVQTFADRLGGPAWSWSRDGAQLVPSLRAACRGGKLDWHLLHTLWRNGAVAAEPCFYHHTGCHGISPPGAGRLAYDHPAYGRMQGGEALLLLGNGLALVGRAKVFYDEPRGFVEVLRDGGSFGDAWARYYEVESRADSWRAVGGDIGRKRSYFWSVLGDATLRLSMAAPR